MRFQSLWQMPLLLGVAATSFTYAAAPAAVAPAAPVVAAAPAPAAGPVDTATLMKQIEDLKKQVSTIAYKQRKAEEKLDATVKVEDAKIGVLQANQVSAFPAGYIAIPGSNSAIKIGGRIKADGTYYAGNNGDTGGGLMNVRTLPLKNSATAGGKSGHVNGTVQSSRLQFNSLTQTNKGDVKAQVLLDFYGTQAGNITTTTTTNSTSTQYGIRVRQAFVTWQNVLAGQTETNFYDDDLMAPALDNLGGVTTSQRRAQFRWTQKVADGLSLSVSAEKPNTDYTSQSAVVTGDNSNFGKSPLPDFTARLRYEGKMGFVSVAGIVRTLQVSVAQGDTVGSTYIGSSSTSSINTTAANSFSSKQNGWGLAFAGKLLVAAKSNLHGRVTVGDGLGYLVEDATGQAAYFQMPTASSSTGSTSNTATRYAARFDTNSVINCVAGYEHWWTEEFRTNIAGSYTKIKNSPYSPIIYSNAPNIAVGTVPAQINARIKKVLVNAIYSPVKNIDVGIELMHGMRETISGVDKYDGSVYYGGATGKATQIMTSFIYKF